MFKIRKSAQKPYYLEQKPASSFAKVFLSGIYKTFDPLVKGPSRFPGVLLVNMSKSL